MNPCPSLFSSCTCSVSLRFRTACPPDVQCYLPAEGGDRTQENKITAICHPVIIPDFLCFHYFPPYVTVLSVQLLIAYFCSILPSLFFTFNDIHLLSIFFRENIHFLLIEEKDESIFRNLEGHGVWISTAVSMMDDLVYILILSDCCQRL